MHDVARLAGVSQATVSFVINEKPDSKVTDATRERVWAAARELGYRPNAVAQGLRLGRSTFIGLVTDAIATTPFAGEVIRGAQDAAWEQQHVLLVVDTGSRSPVEEKGIAMMLEHQVKGIIYSAWYHRAVTPPSSIHEAPSVLVNCYAEANSIPAIVPDEVQGGRSATSLLLARGHRRVASSTAPLPRQRPPAVCRATRKRSPPTASQKTPTSSSRWIPSRREVTSGVPGSLIWPSRRPGSSVTTTGSPWASTTRSTSAASVSPTTSP
jgi:LacI family transcriptional regulator